MSDPAEPAPVEGQPIVVIGSQGRRVTDGKTIGLAPCDFRNPVLVAESDLRRLRNQHVEFTRHLAAKFSAFLRLEFALTLTGLTTTAFSRFAEALPDPAHLTLFKLEPLPGARDHQHADPRTRVGHHEPDAGRTRRDRGKPRPHRNRNRFAGRFSAHDRGGVVPPMAGSIRSATAPGRPRNQRPLSPNFAGCDEHARGFDGRHAGRVPGGDAPDRHAVFVARKQHQKGARPAALPGAAPANHAAAGQGDHRPPRGIRQGSHSRRWRTGSLEMSPCATSLHLPRGRRA